LPRSTQRFSFHTASWMICLCSLKRSALMERVGHIDGTRDG
jgi:hypothetical protein